MYFLIIVSLEIATSKVPYVHFSIHNSWHLQVKDPAIIVLSVLHQQFVILIIIKIFFTVVNAP